MLVTTDDLKNKLNKFDSLQTEIIKRNHDVRNEDDCRLLNAMYYQLCKAYNCLDKGLRGEFD